MNWLYEGKPYTELTKGVYGFVYKLWLSDNTMYIGKCDAYEVITIPAKKDGSKRPGHIEFKGKNVIIDPETGYIAKNREAKDALRKLGIKATREPYEKLSKQSNWQDYESSSKEVKSRTVVKKEILELLPTKRSLTYKEEWWQFHFNVLENENYLNKQIGNRYFKGRLL